MSKQLDAKASNMVLQHIRALGIEVVLDRVQEIQGQERVTGIRTCGGAIVPCNAVVLATGVQPAVELAMEAGLTVGRGIRVDDRMQTSDPCVFAVGECAEHRGQVYGLVTPGFEQAAVAAENILGGEARYKGSVTTTLLKGFDLPVVSIDSLGIAPPAHKDIIYEAESPNAYRKLTLYHNRIIQAVAVGQWPEAWRVRETASRRRYLWPWQLRRFRMNGSLWRASSMPPVRAWPADATICNCRGITRGILTQAVQAGYGTLESLQEGGDAMKSKKLRLLPPQWRRQP